jgi:NAD(P)-dependent dehydrogenase (short-subunit alcohol dehydrogenase family)
MVSVTQPRSLPDQFSLEGRVAVITGGAGLLGLQHAQAIISARGVPVLLDLPQATPAARARELADSFGSPACGFDADITKLEAVEAAKEAIVDTFGRLDILINNAANNPRVEAASGTQWTRVENFPMDVWDADIAVGLTGAFLCSRVFGTYMATSGRGVILNVASDLALISPDQRLYRSDGLSESEQMVKPVTYSIVKSGLVGLTRYLATYWADRNVRVNAICPGGVFNGQPADFVKRLTHLIPMGRMASVSEYQGTVVFMCSDASSYMTGSIVAVDGGRTAW